MKLETRTTIRAAIVIILAPALTACAVVKMNDGNIVSVEYEPGMRLEAQKVAEQSCQQVGKGGAEPLTDVSMNPVLPAQWMVKRVASFRCV